jgi:hypothetical protein
MRVAKAAIFFSLTVFGASGQQAPSEPPSENDPSAAARLQREKQIRMYDPLDKSHPLADQQSIPPSVRDSTPGQPGGSSDAVRPDPATRPLRGSAAESNQSGSVTPRTQGPQVLSPDGESPVQEYSGPAVLSRSYTISRPSTPEQVRWSPTLGYLQTYDSGLSNLYSNSGQTQGSPSPWGYVINWGVTGRHFWKHDQVGLDYQGSKSKIGGYSGLNGTNQILRADYEHQFSRRLVLNVVTSGSILSQAYGFLDTGLVQGNSIANISLSASPNVQVIDQGTRQLMNQVSMTWRKSARLSFNASGGAFFVQRTGGLYGNTGYQSQGDVNYRLTRKTTTGVYYSYTGYTFTHRINVANLHTMGGIYSYALGKTSQIRLRAGITRIENEGLRTVTIDPAIAIYLGQSTGVVNSYTVSSTSDVSAEFVKDFGRNRTVNVAYVRGVSPGNGLLLTSLQQGFSGNFSMRVFRNYLVSATGSQTSLSGVSENNSSYNSQSIGLGVSRPLPHHLSADFRVEYRTYNITSQPNLDHQWRVSTGFSWNPGESWLRSW